MSTVTWDAILVTVDGFGFGTLTGESCLKNVHCHTDRASWILVTVRFWSPHVEKVCTVTQFRLWEGGGGGYHWGGGRRTENRDHIFTSLPRLRTQMSNRLMADMSESNQIERDKECQHSFGL